MTIRSTTTSAALLAGLLLAAALPLEAQRRPPLAPMAGAAGHAALLIGGSRLDITDLNARLAGAGYPTFDEEFLQIGLTGARARDRLLLGMEVAGQFRPAAVSADNRWRTSAGGAYAMFNVGVDAFRQAGFSLQPKLGIGGGGISVRITDREAPTFDQVLAQPGRSVHMTTGSVLVDGSLGVLYRTGPRLGGRGFVIGARAGYTQSLLRGEWMRDRTDAPGGPRAGWAGPHVELMVGRTRR
jgi:hypothetical protein